MKMIARVRTSDDVDEVMNSLNHQSYSGCTGPQWQQVLLYQMISPAKLT